MVANDSVSLQQNKSAEDIWRSNSGTNLHKGFLPITIFQINFQIKSAEENSHPASSRGRGQEEACAGCHTDALKYELN